MPGTGLGARATEPHVNWPLPHSAPDSGEGRQTITVDHVCATMEVQGGHSGSVERGEGLEKAFCRS